MTQSNAIIEAPNKGETLCTLGSAKTPLALIN